MLKNFLKPILLSCYLLSIICCLTTFPRKTLAADPAANSPLSFFVYPAQAISDSSPYWGDFVAPPIQIPIPTVSITKDSVKCEGDYCEIPWIGQYVAGIYKYAIGVVGIVAAIMLMVGGVRWLTAGGNASAVTDAQSYITGSLTGLVLALLSYTILYTINPALVSFKPIRVKMVEKVAIMSNTGGLSCSAITNESECNADKQQLGYEFYKGASCPGADVSCKDAPDPIACYSGIMCCCTRSAQAGCSWSDKHNVCAAGAPADWNRCGTNTINSTTCCCPEAGTGGAETTQALLNCVQGVASGFGSVSTIRDTAFNQNCCQHYNLATCKHTQNSCHFGCSNNYQSMAIDWYFGVKADNSDCPTICNVAGQINSSCKKYIDSDPSTYNFIGPARCSCGGYVPQSNHNDHFHLSTKGCHSSGD
jgi:hypothetical protein